MVRANRKLTGAVLLASYIAATIGAWSHGRHDCREVACASHDHVTRACRDHGLAIDFDRPLSDACGDSSHCPSESLAVLGTQPDAHSHHIDQCLICQFLAIQKVIELSAGAPQTATVLAHRLVIPAHDLFAAERIGTPDSRGPPRAC